ncbi:helix-turn-helix domain-containing protein [Streptomyces tateyamensis]|uniref:helix-turn-helix domain-containing protein n=1 Tax=Streptomyces tateyamensis TaxID=565073 RepID=UPI0015E8E932|nr:helix-turn-helix transcriptional regulator [Streptomyces tateyamensis]
MNRKKLDPKSGPYAPFGIQLRRLREEKGWTQGELGRRMGYSDTHISAVETALKSPKLEFALAADKALDSGNQLELLWWSAQHGALIEGLPEYLNIEAKAIAMRMFEINIIPAILQTLEYARVYETALVARGRSTAEQVEERMNLLQSRQRCFERSPMPTVHAVLDEACLRRPIGGAQVMARQLRHLETMAQCPGVTIQVAPFELGEDRPFYHPVWLLTLPHRAMVGYGETLKRGFLERDADTVAEWARDYDQLQVEALSRAASLRFIRRLREEFEKHAA